MHWGASAMIEAGVRRRSARPPPKAMSNTLAAAAVISFGVGGMRIYTEVSAVTRPSSTARRSVA